MTPRLRLASTLLVIAASASVVPPAFAQATPGPRVAALTEVLALPEPLGLGSGGQGVLDLADALAAALQGNPDVEAARARAEQARLGPEVAGAALRPRADLRLSGGRGRLESVEPERSLDREDHALVVRQALFDAGAWRETHRQRHLSAAAQAQAAAARSQVLLDTANAVVALAQARIGLHAAEAHEAVLLELQQQLVDGASPQAAADRERIAARLANVRSGASSSRASVQASLRTVERLAGLSPAALRLASIREVQVPADDRQALRLLRARNDDLQAARAELRAAEADVAVREARFLPRVDLELIHQRSRNVGGLPLRFQDTRAQAVLNLPLAAGGADLAARRQSLARVDESAARLLGTERRLVQEIETAYSDLRSGVERYASVRAELDGNRRIAEAFRARSYGADLPVNDVLEAHQRVATSRTDLAQVVVSVTQTRWRLARLLGALEVDLLGAAPGAPGAARPSVEEGVARPSVD